jgi:hypothetical protein
MEQPVRVERYGMMVFELPKMDLLRRSECMCLFCSKMIPGSPDNCPAAQTYYEACKKYGNAFIMTRCGSWAPKTEEAK